MSATHVKRLAIGIVTASLLLGNTVLAQNELRNPGIELAGDDGDDTAAGWQTDKAWVIRTNEDSHTGDWSLEIDNTAPSDWGWWKELNATDPVDPRVTLMINPDGDETLGADCLNCYAAIPGETYLQSAWIKILEPTFPGSDPPGVVGGEDPGATFLMVTRPNFENIEPTVQMVAPRLDDMPINEWIEIRNEFEMPYENSAGDEIWIAQPLWALDLGADHAEDLEGRILYDDLYFGLLEDTGEDCLDGVNCARSDINQNGSVDFADFVILSTDFGKSSPHAAGGVANIPEPAGLVLLTLGGLLLVRRRRS